MDFTLSERVQSIKPSPTLAVAAKASQLKAQGKDIIGLGTGEPDFDTPQAIKQAAIAALNQGHTKYTPVDGIPELKSAIIDKFKRDNQLEYQAQDILVSVGGKQSIYNLAQALLNPGDEVIIPAPFWVSYPDIVKLAGAKPVIIETTFEQDYKINPQQLANAITPQTRLLFINSPSNPSGKVYTKEELVAFGDVLKQHPQVMIATDDMYEHILWTDEPFSNIAMACPELKHRSVVLNGVSKAYAMTGWRIGYCAGPAVLIQAMKKIQSQSTSNPTSIAQYAATEALKGSQEVVSQMTAEFHKRHDFVFETLKHIKDVRVTPADGTFYIFPDISQSLKRLQLRDDVQFAERLLEDAGVALVPGSAFGCAGCIRLSFATDLDTLTEALKRLEKFMEK